MKRHERGWLGTAALLGLWLTAGGCGGGKAPQKQPIEHDKVYCVRMAESQFNGGRVSEALATLQEAIGRFPDDASLHHRYGLYCLQAARYDEAIAAFTQSLELDPHLTDSHNNLGIVYLELGEFGRAESEFYKVLEDPAYPTPHLTELNLGLLYAEQGREDEAVAHLRRAVGIDPKFFKGHFHLASVLDQIGQLLEAAREYEVAEPAFRNDGEYWYRRGFTYYRLGEEEKARESLLRVRAIAPGSESAARADQLLSVLD
jgi:tetratricopeptide (TPR) repeat protein